MMRRSVVVVVLVVLAGAALVPLLAFANHLDPVDRDDTRGKLDVRVVRTWGAERRGWRIATYPRWRVRTIYDRGFALVHLDTFGSQRADYYIVVFARPPAGTRLSAELFRDRRHKPDYKLADVRVWRPNRRSLSIVLPLDEVFIGSRRNHISWNVETLWTGRRCAQVCFDLVPDDGLFVVEPLGPEPSPSPSTTVMPSPSPSV